jgi:hypothetical protein
MFVDFKENEVVIKAGDTDHLFESEKIKGKLIVTNQRIYFRTIEEEAGKFNLEILPEEICEVHYFNIKKILPSGLEIITKDGEHLKFTIKKRNAWGELINKMY